VWSKAAGGAGSKTVRIYPSDASGTLSGSLTTLLCPYNFITSLNVSGCTSLVFLFVNNNSLTSLDASGLAALQNLNCSDNSLTSLNVSGCTALGQLRCSDNSLTSLTVSGLPLTTLICNANALTSLRAQNVGFSGGSYYSYSSAFNSVFIRNNQLNAAALNQFYTDLAAGNSPLLVDNNPGTTGDDPSIATAKGYTVYGS
jgi:hypothetical protein